jgi:hypothetical protein
LTPGTSAGCCCRRMSSSVSRNITLLLYRKIHYLRKCAAENLERFKMCRQILRGAALGEFRADQRVRFARVRYVCAQFVYTVFTVCRQDRPQFASRTDFFSLLARLSISFVTLTLRVFADSLSRARFSTCDPYVGVSNGRWRAQETSPLARSQLTKFY